LALLSTNGEQLMQILFESRAADGNHMRDHSVERVRFNLRRLQAWVARAKVQFSDVNGPRGGVDKRCQVELHTMGAGTVVISSLAQDWRTALDRPLARANRVLRRSLQHSRRPVRGHAAKLTIDS
jgi:hypothetical protein